MRAERGPVGVEQRQTSDAERVDQVARHARNLPADHPWTAGSYRLQTVERCPNAWSWSRSKSSSRGRRDREPLTSSDSKSGGHLERVVIDGERYIVKHVHVDDDWIMRATGDVRCRPLLVWTSGLIDRLPSSIDTAMVGVAVELGRHGWGGALLMHDRSEWLVPEGDDPVPLDQHLRFLDHMAEMHATFWDWEDDDRLDAVRQPLVLLLLAPSRDRGGARVDRRGAADQCTRLGAIRRTSG